MGVRHASHHAPFPLFTTKILSVGQNTAAARCSDAAYVWGVDYGIIPDTDDGYAFAPPEKDSVMSLHPQPITAVPEHTTWYASEEGRPRYQCRAGVEGTLSQGVRGFGLRRTRFRGLAKTHLQHVAIAAALNIDRIVAWLNERPRAKTRTSRFAALAPVHDLPLETPSI
jgi:hypothetical protein